MKKKDTDRVFEMSVKVVEKIKSVKCEKSLVNNNVLG